MGRKAGRPPSHPSGTTKRKCYHMQPLAIEGLQEIKKDLALYESEVLHMAIYDYVERYRKAKADKKKAAQSVRSRVNGQVP